ncbi:LOW QUALITY PROTEIN: filamin-A-like [Centruroides vittatus]|uniref:LOW QUALITY PROTEIN: filamin-A-like n=2 Tax=Centruroides TaxID=6875 RepID=UPI00350EE41A
MQSPEEKSAGQVPAEGEEDEMERDLAEDAAWKRIQQNTFTRWANEHLKTANKNINNLETDLSDGLRLIALVEVLSGKKLPKHNKRPNFISQKLENVSVALKFLEDDEGIKIVNIDSSDIVDCKLKLILGLIWTLILHYSISLPMWEGEEFGDKTGPSPKQRLLGWIQSKLPDVPINNFTSDWNDGRAVGALVDAVAPGLCPDWPDWTPANALKNAKEAMDLADKWLGIPQLVKPEEMVNPNVDDLSMMTYLSQFPSAKLKPNAPLRPRTNPNRVRCYGPGIEPSGVNVGAPTNFTVETFSAGKGDVKVVVENPKGQPVPVEIKFNDDRSKTYTVTYTAKMEGVHKVKVYFANKEVPKSPFSVTVEGHAGDPKKVTASGPGLEPTGVMIGRPTYFDIFSKDAGRGQVEVKILDPQGNRNTVPCRVRKIADDVHRCEYVAQTVGLHSVNVFFAGQQIPNSPFGVKVTPVCDARKVRASGRGLQPNGVRVRDMADFKVYTENAGEGVLNVKVIGPGGATEHVDVRKIDETTYECIYRPMKEGRYVVTITYENQEINGSPFEVNVGPFKDSKIRAYGPGLLGGVAGYPACFTVETNGETGSLGFSIEGPSQAKIECHDNRDGSADVKYYPPTPGEYAVHILCNNEDIPKSPYIVQILPKTDYFPEKVEAYGPGLQKSGVVQGQPTEFTIDKRKAGGNAPLNVTITDEEYRPVDLKIQDNKDGTYKCSYKPTKNNKHTVQINYGGVAIPKSPFRVQVSEPTDAGKVKVFGPGVEKGVKAQTPTHFNIDCRDAGPGAIKVKLTDEKGNTIPVKLQDNEDGTYTCDYVAPNPGNYKVSVSYANMEIPNSPIKVTVGSKVDVSKIKVDGLEPTAPINSLQQFRVITQGAGGSHADFSITITSPSGRKIQAHVIPTAEGFLVNFTPTELGEYLLIISFGGTPLSPHPFRMTCMYPVDHNKVRAFGPGLSKGQVNRPAEFMIDTRGAGQGNLGVTVEGPCEAAINCRDNGDGTCSVVYFPTEVGDYNINITFNNLHIPGSPFTAIMMTDVDVRNIRVMGSGIQPQGVFLDSPTDFIVDARAVSKRSDAKVQCTITNPSGTRTDSLVHSLNDGTYRICYTPFEEGRHTIDISYDGVPVPGSPFKVNVMRGCDPRKCKAFGPGLEHGIVNQVNTFTVETKGAGSGGLGLAIEGPSEAKMTCRDNRDGSCTVEYIPTEEGQYDIGIKFADQHISGSPFKIPVTQDVDASKVKAYGPGVEPNNCRAGVPLSFTVDAKKSGKAPLDVDIQTDRGPLPKKPDIKDNRDGTYTVTYFPPPENSKCNVNVKYGGKPIPGSPFQMKVKPKVEPQKVKLHGPGVSNKGVPASIPAEFTIDAKDAGFAEPEVSIKGPDGRPCKAKIVNNNDGTYKVTYVPDDVGPYNISVKYGGQEVPNSPMMVNSFPVGHPEKCKITEGKQEKLQIGEEYCITVNSQQAGTGAVTCRITSTTGADSDVDIQVEDNGDGTFSLFYTVKDTGQYTISIKFGGQPIPGGVFTVNAVTEEVHKKTTVKQTTTTKTEYRCVQLQNIPIPSVKGKVTAEVIMPSGKQDKPVVVDNKDGTVSVKYDPKEEGLHELHVKYNNEHIQGSPFKFHVDTITSGYVTAYGPGLTHGIAGESCNFTIYTKEAGAGGLSVAVEGPSKAEISCNDNKDGTVGVSYLPVAPGEYKIMVKFADKHIKGSPFTAKITGEGRKRNQISVGHSSEVSLKVQEKDIKNLNASIVAPSGLEEPCYLKKLPNGHLGISFTPREVGEHLVNVKRVGKHIQGSPFNINVLEREVGDATKVKVSGNALKEGKTHTENEFKIDTKEAGFGGLSLSIEGPSKADIKCKDNEDGTLAVTYKPTEPGYYIINLKFADHHIPGSPYTVKVSGEGSNIQRENIKKQREALPVTEVGSQCKLTYKLPGTNAFEMAAKVTSPNGETEDAEIMDLEDCLYAVNFVPKEVGVHIVSVRYKDIHIPGSPFQFTVGPLSDSGAHRVHAGGPGLERGCANEPCEFNVWTREAGAGSLAISVEGPSKAEIDFKDRKDGSCYVSYVVSEPGEYRVGIKFNDRHIPDSPCKVYIMPQVGDVNKIMLGQVPDDLQINKPVAFYIQMNGAKGSLDGKVLAPSGVEDDCFIIPIDEDQWALRFVPQENGIHQIHIRCNGIHIPESPFRARVGKDDADPAAVNATGNGLKEAKTGTKSDFIIDTCSAGAGTLAVTVDGPSKVAMDCTEVEEGYKVRYTPLAPGDYYVTVKYNGYHIVGSPFKVKCTGNAVAEVGSKETSTVVVETVTKHAKQRADVLPRFKSDASKITSKGMGLKRAFLHKQNQFQINAGSAGNNVLYCAVYGPKGPSDEVFVKHLGCNMYQVSYTVKERGDHVVIIKWGDENIPGSPFRVEV